MSDHVILKPLELAYEFGKVQRNGLVNPETCVNKSLMSNSGKGSEGLVAERSVDSTGQAEGVLAENKGCICSWTTAHVWNT